MNRVAVAAAVAVLATVTLSWFAMRRECRLPIERYSQGTHLNPAPRLEDELARAHALCTARHPVAVTRDGRFVWTTGRARMGSYRAAYRIDNGALVFFSTGAGDVIDFTYYACGGELRYGTRPGPVSPGLSSACPAIASLTSSLAMTR